MPVDVEIENVPEALVSRLRVRAARHDRSVEDEVLAILDEFTREPKSLPPEVEA